MGDKNEMMILCGIENEQRLTKKDIIILGGKEDEHICI